MLERASSRVALGIDASHRGSFWLVKRRIGFAALLAWILAPLVGGLVAFTGDLDHILWMKVAGVTLVMTFPLGYHVVFPLVRRQHERRQRRTAPTQDRDL